MDLKRVLKSSESIFTTLGRPDAPYRLKRQAEKKNLSTDYLVTLWRVGSPVTYSFGA